ncbi:hypothetical protein KVG96_12385 [Pseudomonas sp. COR58]|uniref:Uncharacterized protein n=1 Tax=Pseudomonas ekonensis TaxID=2842353 RepID=A0ABS6PE49_9PSED|nr:hypothetical protein [Pseudomonas ekonensis]MBV4458751.1 hypothetical protein [Pseudomonas ekonensis]
MNATDGGTGVNLGQLYTVDEQTKRRSGTTLSGTFKDSALHIFGGATWRS